MFKRLFKGKLRYVTWSVVIIVIALAINFMHGLVINTRLSTDGYVSSGHFPTYPIINYAGMTKEEIKHIKRGEYIVKAGDCIACHTAPKPNAKPYAGGLPMQTPFGVIYSPNITPDVNTGIGSWQDDDFKHALHDGVRPDGQFYYPAFPYLYFNQITFDDIKAIRAYLKAIPPVSQKNIEPDMIFPFNWRFIQLGWRILFFYPERNGPYVFNADKSKTWNIGKYIVQGAGHCAMCHTPSYYLFNQNVSMGAPIRKYDLTGAVIEGYLAPNISKSNLGAIPDNELIKVFTNYQLVGGAEVKGPMKEAIHDSLINLDHETLLGIVQYLKSVESKIPPVPDVSESATGASVFNNYCAGCHLSGVGGAPRVGHQQSWETLARSGMDKLYTVAINGGGNMPARGTCITCTNDEIRQAVDYMVAASNQQIAERKKKPTPALTPQQSYERYCASCHSNTGHHAPQLDDKQAWDEISNKGYLAAYRKIMAGNEHPANAGCAKCSDSDILAALKYMMQRGTGKGDYMLW